MLRIEKKLNKVTNLIYFILAFNNEISFVQCSFNKRYDPQYIIGILKQRIFSYLEINFLYLINSTINLVSYQNILKKVMQEIICL